MNITKKILGLFLSLSLSHFANAQYEDAGLWLNVNTEFTLNPNNSLLFNQLGRFDENVSQLGTWGIEGGFLRNTSKNTKVSIMYRTMGRRRLDDTYSIRHRLFCDLSRKSEWLGLFWQARLRLQLQKKDVLSSPNGLTSTEKYIRPLFFVSKRLSYHWSLFLMDELFIPVDLTQKKDFFVDRNMAYIGCNFRVNRHVEIITYYLQNRALFSVNPRTDHVTGIRLDLTL